MRIQKHPHDPDKIERNNVTVCVCVCVYIYRLHPFPVTRWNATVRSRQPLHAFASSALKELAAPSFANVMSPLLVIVLLLLLLLLLSTRDCAKSLVIGAGGNCVRSTCELTVRWLGCWSLLSRHGRVARRRRKRREGGGGGGGGAARGVHVSCGRSSSAACCCVV